MIPDISVTLAGWEAVWVLAAAVYGAYRAVRLVLMMPLSGPVGGGA